MKHIFTLLIIGMIVLTGCATKKKIQRSTTISETVHSEIHAEQLDRQEITEKNHTAVDAVTSELLRRYLESQSTSDLNFRATVFDTTKPTDPETGRPPVLAEVEGISQQQTTTRENQTAEKKEETKAVEEKQKIESRDTDTVIDAAQDKQTDAEMVEKEKKISHPKIWLYILSLVLLVAGVYWLWPKIKRNLFIS